MGRVVDALIYKRPADIIALKTRLTDHQLAILQSEQVKYRRSVFLAYLLWLFLWPLGAHKFYLAKARQGFGYIALFCVMLYLNFGMAAADEIGFELAAAFSVLVLLAALLVDMLTLPKQTRDVWANAERDIIEQMLSRSS